MGINQSFYSEKVYPSGKYTGEFRNNLRHGKGKFQWNNGDVYEGDWQYDLQHGKGVHTWSTGSNYNGDWSNGKRHGYGNFFSVSQKSKVGIWDRGSFLRKTKSSSIPPKRKLPHICHRYHGIV